MEFVRKIVDASRLMEIMQLPDTLRNKRLEVIILPADETPAETNHELIDNFEVSDITQSLLGCIPLSDVSLEEIREERLAKYENESAV